MAASPPLIALLEEKAKRDGAIFSPKERFQPARRHPGGAEAALKLGMRSRRGLGGGGSQSPPNRSLSPSGRRQSPLRSQDAPRPVATTRFGEEKVSFRINTPQRVEPPVGFKVEPRREIPIEEDEGHMNNNNGNNGNNNGGASKSSSRAARIPGAVLSKIKDYTMLSAACRRAGRSREEGISNFNIGVLYDNHCEYKKAIQFYLQFLEVCKSGKDVSGEALAYNSIAVDYQKLGENDAAIEFHQKHLEIADVPGKFVAHSNLGLCHAAKDEVEKASLNHRQAMRYAILMESLPGESLACGNLAIVRSKKGDHPIAKACMERHLKLSSALGDGKAQADAYEHLGQLAIQSGNFQDASQYFELARGAARKTGDGGVATAAKCHVGMALGNMQFDDYLSQVADRLGAAVVGQE